MEIFTMAFMQRALLAALLSGLIAPAIGTYIVQRRMSLLGDGLGHVAIMGVGLAMMTHTAPMPAAIAVCVGGSILVELLRQRGKASGDVGLAILFYGGLASGVMMAGVAHQGPATLSSYLFGSLTTVSNDDLQLIVILTTVVLVLTLGLAPQLFAVTFDQDYAKVLGLPHRILNLAVVILAAITVTISMRTVGLLLVSALMVTPVATANNLAVGFRKSLLLAMSLGAGTALLGTSASYYLDTASGATIVVLSIILFLLSLPLGTWLRDRRFVAFVEDDHPDRPHIVAENHQRPHDLEHSAKIQHGDHYDFLHNGHRHAQHGDHFDEH